MLAIIINKTNVPADLRSSVSVVIVVKVVIGVRVNSKHSACEKIQQSDWFFHSYLRQAFFTFNFSFLIS